MESNLHNVLFVPADGVMYVANADHKKPAAENRYVKFDLKKLLASMKKTTTLAGLNNKSRRASANSFTWKTNRWRRAWEVVTCALDSCRVLKNIGDSI